MTHLAMMYRAIIFISALIICCCFCNKSEAQQHHYQPGVLFVWENNLPRRMVVPTGMLVPIAFVGKDSIYEPSTSHGDSLGDLIPLTIPKYQSPYHRKDSTYVFYHDGKVIERFHVPDRDSTSPIDTDAFNAINYEIEAEQIDAPWPRGLDSGLELLGGSSCYFRDHEGYSVQPSPSVRKKILATCKRLFPKKWKKLSNSEFDFSISVLKFGDDSTQKEFVTVYVMQIGDDGLYPGFFAILRRLGSNFIPEFTQSDVDGQDVDAINGVIGLCDIGGDDNDAMVVEEYGYMYDSAGVAILQRQGTTWKKIYEHWIWASVGN